MAEIRPLRAWRYHTRYTNRINELISPLFDVISEKQRRCLYEHPHNSIHISAPRSSAGSQHAYQKIKQWKKNNIIIQDTLPSIYVYYQYFKMPGSNKTVCRKGFMTHVRTYDWKEKIILRHENTMPHIVAKQRELIKATCMHASATHGLYSDKDFKLEKWMNEAITYPIYEVENYQGVKDVMAIIHDKKVIDTFIRLISTKQILLADGHHRYQGSIQYTQACQQSNPSHTGQEGYNFNLMYLSNMESDDLKIFPTHRIVRGIENFDSQDIESKLEVFFDLFLVDFGEIERYIAKTVNTFGILMKGKSYVVKLKPNLYQQMTWSLEMDIKSLDVTILHYFILEKILGISKEKQSTSSHIVFDQDMLRCHKIIEEGIGQMAVITKSISVQRVKEISQKGQTMPQKSTYFYPKIVGGLLFASTKEDEFVLPPYLGFN